jgi:ADP-heptose:LPS heptosyltransferase
MASRSNTMAGEIDGKKYPTGKMKGVSSPTGKFMRKNVANQTYRDRHGAVHLKPGQFVPQHVIDRFNIDQRYFVHPGSIGAKKSFEFAHEKKGKFSVGIIRDMNGRGDVLMASVIAKALKYKYMNDVTVYYTVQNGYQDILKGNPYIDQVFTDRKAMQDKSDISINVNDLEFKTELKMFEEDDRILKNRASIYLEQMGLHLENKTPAYVVTEAERADAKMMLKGFGYDLTKPIIGIQLYGSNVTRTYPHMEKVEEMLRKEGYQVLVLDEKISTDLWRYDHRQVGAFIEQMAVTVTPNSFFYHLAGAMKKRAVAVFGSCNGEIWVQDYEKVIACQIDCPLGKQKCWWSLPCLGGKTLRDKEATHAPECLAGVEPEAVFEAVTKQLCDYQKVLVVVLSYNMSELTKQMIDSVRSFHNYDILLLDNGSTDDTIEWCKSQGIEVQINEEAVHSAWNRALRVTKQRGYDYCLLCNNDSILSPTYIDTVVEVAERRQAYAVTGSVVNKRDGDEVNFVEKTRSVEIPQMIMVPGDYSALLLSRKCIDKIGGFKYFAQRYQADEDHLLRLRLVDETLIKTHATTFFHKHGAVWRSTMSRESRDKEWTEGLENFKREWKIDPYKNRTRLSSLEWVKSKNPDWKEKIKRPLE